MARRGRASRAPHSLAPPVSRAPHSRASHLRAPHSPGPRSRARAVALLGASIALLLVGCEALLGTAFGSAQGGNFPSPSPIAAYTTGTATITIKGGETIKLDKLAADSGVNSLFGSNVRWTGQSGWNMRLNGAGSEAGFGTGSGFLTFDRIVEDQHLTTYDASRCIVQVEVIDAKSLDGTATCKGVEWYDALDLPFGGGGAFGEGRPTAVDQPKFDAEVTFEAFP